MSGEAVPHSVHANVPVCEETNTNLHSLNISSALMENFWIKYNRKVIALHAAENGICRFADLLWYRLGGFVVFMWMYEKCERPELVVQMQLMKGLPVENTH